MPISLFYLYTDVPDAGDLAARLKALGPPHGLAGRVRVSPEGLNATVGGPAAGIEALHSFVLDEFPGADIDFKVSASGGADELGRVWRVRRVAEVVTLGVDAQGISWRDAQPHISARQFRDEVQAMIGRKKAKAKSIVGRPSAPSEPIATAFHNCSNNPEDLVNMRDTQGGSIDPASSWSDGDRRKATAIESDVTTEEDSTVPQTVVLDVRNRYESAIGRFDGAMLADIRQFSELRDFVRARRGEFAGRRVLMYCTGGVRCEKASALLRAECDVASVAQLHGGIERFLGEFPDGGDVFRGRNLVFDGRMAVGRCGDVAVGRCVCCEAPFDDYSAGWRCSRCRARVLVCEARGCAVKWEQVLQAICVECRENKTSNVLMDQKIRPQAVVN